MRASQVSADRRFQAVFLCHRSIRLPVNGKPDELTELMAHRAAICLSQERRRLYDIAKYNRIRKLRIDRALLTSVAASTVDGSAANRTNPNRNAPENRNIHRHSSRKQKGYQTKLDFDIEGHESSSNVISLRSRFMYLFAPRRRRAGR